MSYVMPYITFAPSLGNERTAYNFRFLKGENQAKPKPKAKPEQNG